MIQETVNIDSHVPDEDLLRFIDRECDDVERQRITRHLAACDQCTESHGTLLGTSHELEDLLSSLDELPRPGLRQSVLDRATAVVSLDTVSTAPSRRVWLRVAAAVAGLIAISLTAPSVRAWIVEQFAPVTDLFGGAEPPSVQETATPVPDRTSSTVSFLPTAGVWRRSSTIRSRAHKRANLASGIGTNWLWRRNPKRSLRVAMERWEWLCAAR